MPFGNIYIIENTINNKIYVGQTTQTLHKRFLGHIHDANRKTRKCFSKLGNAINKYGKSNFTIKLLKSCSNKEELDYYEKLYIELFDGCNSGYNIQLGANGRGCVSKETKQKLAVYFTGNHCSPTKPIKVFSKKGVFIEESISGRELAKKYNISQSSVSQCASGKRSYIRNFILIYKELFTEELLQEKIKKVYCRKKGIICCSNGKKYKNQEDAAKDLRVSKSTISSYIQNKTEHRKYIFWIEE